MLTVEENVRVTRIGPGTSCGNYFRRFWWPMCLSSELPEPDGSPLRVRLLGEDLIAYRGTDGKVGLVDAYCPHRRAPLFFGRNEECGIRCVYHGWKFDRHGDCVDMPSEPAGTTLQAKVKILAYPTIEKGGVVWAYMGPKELQPPEPDYEWTRAPATHRYVSKTLENCNYLQAIEGGLDTAHSSFAHNNKLHDRANLRQHDRAPNIDVERTDYGYCYVSTRHVDDGKYIRVYHYVMPAQQLRASIIGYEGVRNKPARLDGHIWVPIDDTTTFVYNIMCAPHPEDVLEPEAVEKRETAAGRGKADTIPGTFRLKRNQDNDYLIDRQMQKTQNYTGIVGVNTQDFALQEGMGPICDRSKEFLGTSDKAIVAMRRLLLDAIAQNEKGGTLRALHPETYRNVRAYDRVIPDSASWKDAMQKDLVAIW
jgi:phenylpropionate dioxygenase-like ring-hydroxylating dioxygenase large terminal subunit